MDLYISVLKKYVVFSGRARRKEYWMFMLFNMIFMCIAAIIDNITGLATDAGYGVFYAIYGIAVMLPSLAVSVRRLHDIGKSGWMLLIGLIPIVGGIVLLVFAIKDSQPGDNEYGANPKETIA